MGEECEERKRLFLQRVDDGQDDICVNFLSRIKKDMYQCCLKCAENDAFTDKEYIDCIYDCYMVTSGANHYITASFDDIKRRFKTCVDKCDSGAGYNPEETDGEGDDGEVTAEELKEESFSEYPNSDFLLNDYLKEFENDNLEHTPEPVPEMEVDLKDRSTCTHLCVQSYFNILEKMLTTMRRDLSATFLAKKDLQGDYYDWSRTLDPENVF